MKKLTERKKMEHKEKVIKIKYLVLLSCMYLTKVPRNRQVHGL